MLVPYGDANSGFKRWHALIFYFFKQLSFELLLIFNAPREIVPRPRRHLVISRTVPRLSNTPSHTGLHPPPPPLSLTFPNKTFKKQNSK